MICSNCRTRRWIVGTTMFLLSFVLSVPTTELVAQSPTSPRTPTRSSGLKVGRFPVDVRTEYTVADGLPTNDVFAVAVLPSHGVYAATAKGLVRFDAHRWIAVAGVAGAVKLLAPSADGLLAVTADGLFQVRGNSVERIAELPESRAIWPP